MKFKLNEALVDDFSDSVYNINEGKAEDQIPGQISIFDNYRKFVELPTFRKDWRAEGLTEEDLRDLQNQILNNPESASDLGDIRFRWQEGDRSR